MANKALTWGRFTLLTTGHLTMVRSVLKKWPELCIGLLDLDSLPARHDPLKHRVSADFHAQIVRKSDPRRNPFSVDERRGMWRAALVAAGLADQVSCVSIPVPEFYPEEMNRRFPPAEFDLVFGDSTDAFDQAKLAELRRLLDREVTNVEPDFVMHATQAKSAVAAGASWADYVPAGALEFFLAIDGPGRLELGERP